jgi:hypothetical protein
MTKKILFSNLKPAIEAFPNKQAVLTAIVSAA